MREPQEVESLPGGRGVGGEGVVEGGGVLYGFT